jgi:hypothetical protein
MKRKKAVPDMKELERKYEEPVSLWPLKPEDVLAAFMKVDPEKVEKREKQRKGTKKGIS